MSSEEYIEECGMCKSTKIMAKYDGTIFDLEIIFVRNVIVVGEERKRENLDID